MRRHPVLRTAIAVSALAVLGAPCSTSGPQPRDFTAGALVIPMDNCYQKRDSSGSNQTQSCNAANDDGVLRAYGLVYFLLKKGITVYWTIDGATPKAGATAPDVLVPAPASGAVVHKYDWASRAVVDFTPTFPPTTGITYLGGPFIVDAAQTLLSHLHRGQLVILESTTFPGFTREVLLPKLAESGLKVGEDFFESPEAGPCGTMIFLKQVGHSICEPAAAVSAVICCPQTGHANLNSLIASPENDSTLLWGRQSFFTVTIPFLPRKFDRKNGYEESITSLAERQIRDRAGRGGREIHGIHFV